MTWELIIGTVFSLMVAFALSSVMAWPAALVVAPVITAASCGLCQAQDFNMRHMARQRAVVESRERERYRSTR
jgi:hypothetical protein